MRPSNFLLFPLMLSIAGLAGGVLAVGAGDSALAREAPAGSPAGQATVKTAMAAPSGGAMPTGSIAAKVAYRWFPALYDPSIVPSAAPLPTDIFDEGEANGPGTGLEARLPLLANNQIVAFYGKPGSKRMGILGEYPKEQLADLLEGYSRLYDEANGPTGVIPAFYLIYGTCWPEGEIGYLKESVALDYIEYARSRGMIVFIDHQIGKYSVDEAVSRLLPFLKYPNVHLALDPEWRTTAPMEEIGGISAEELNSAQAAIQRYMDREGIPGIKMLVVHQFKDKMIEGRERVKADFERVLLIHTADGFGAPAIKKSAYSFNARAANMPLKGFKLFFKTTVPGAGYDDPLLTPPDVLALEPRPVLVIYQ